VSRTNSAASGIGTCVNPSLEHPLAVSRVESRVELCQSNFHIAEGDRACQYLLQQF
jgi:hypothetical protein